MNSQDCSSVFPTGPHYRYSFTYAAAHSASWSRFLYCFQFILQFLPTAVEASPFIHPGVFHLSMAGIPSPQNLHISSGVLPCVLPISGPMISAACLIWVGGTEDSPQVWLNMHGAKCLQNTTTQ